MSIQGSVNQLLGIGAAVAAYGTKQAADKYAQTRGAEYQKAYQANVEATKAKYTKSGALSKSKKAQETALAAQQAQPGPASKAYWNKATESKLASDYEVKMGKLGKVEAEEVAKLKEATAQGKQATAKAFGQYESIAPSLLAKMSPEERWKTKATERLMQKDAFNNFLEKITKQGEAK